MKRFLFLSYFIIILWNESLSAWKLQHSNHIPLSHKQISTDSILKSSKSIISKAIISFAITSIPFTTIPPQVQAKTYFDINVYGDKELKIATVNKLKQKLRNAILQDPNIASDFIRLSINDALGYDMNDLSGGSDGSIQYEINKKENINLIPSYNIINQIKKDLQRTNTLSLSDVIAYAGCEALEAVGCDRIPVQIGRYDVNKENVKTKLIPWSNNDDLSNSNIVKEAFVSSGLDVRDIVLLLGSIGETERIVHETKTVENQSQSEEEEEDDKPLDEEPFVPVTFGRRDEIYGAKVGKHDFGSKYLKNILTKDYEKGKDPITSVLLNDPQLKSYVQKYADNSPAFIKDVSDAYIRLTSLGKEFTNRNS